MPLLAEVVDTDAVLQTLWTALVAGLGVTVAFSLLIVAGVRGAEARRAGAGTAALLYGLLGALALLVTGALIALGLFAMASTD